MKMWNGISVTSYKDWPIVWCHSEQLCLSSSMFLLLHRVHILVSSGPLCTTSTFQEFWTSLLMRTEPASSYWHCVQWYYNAYSWVTSNRNVELAFFMFNTTRLSLYFSWMTTHIYIFYIPLNDHKFIITVLWHCWLGDKKDIRPVKISHEQSPMVLLWQTYERPGLTGSNHCQNNRLANEKPKAVTYYDTQNFQMKFTDHSNKEYDGKCHLQFTMSNNYPRASFKSQWKLNLFDSW